MGEHDGRESPLRPELTTDPAPSMALDEPIPVAVRRIVGSLIDGAVSDLQPDDAAAVDLGVHAARKKVKRIRAVLRLVRGSSGPTIFRTEDRQLRDTTRTISELRDAAVLIDTLDGVGERHIDALDPAALRHTHRWLTDRYRRVRASTSPAVWADAIGSLTEIRTRFATYPLEDLIRDDFDSLGPGLRRTYRRGRREHRRSAEDPTVHTLHEWRKSVKYLRYQLEALGIVEPDRIGTLVADLDLLGERLGADHDLAVLAATLRSNRAASLTDTELRTLSSLIEIDRSRLHTDALTMGQPLYALRPRDFETRIRDLWTTQRDRHLGGSD